MELCRDCRLHPKVFDRGISLFSYRSVSKSLMAMKYKDRRDLAVFFAEEFVSVHGKTVLSWKPEALIPVPLHPLRRFSRGYNQAELLAVEIGKRLSIPVIKTALQRKRYTKPQKFLADKKRAQNLQGAFRVRQGAALPKVLILVDDIYTTGSTAQGCSLALKKAGAERVFVITMASGSSGSNTDNVSFL